MTMKNPTDITIGDVLALNSLSVAAHGLTAGYNPPKGEKFVALLLGSIPTKDLAEGLDQPWYDKAFSTCQLREWPVPSAYSARRLNPNQLEGKPTRFKVILEVEVEAEDMALAVREAFGDGLEGPVRVIDPTTNQHFLLTSEDVYPEGEPDDAD